MIEITSPNGDGPSRILVTDDHPPKIQIEVSFEVAAAMHEMLRAARSRMGEGYIEAVLDHSWNLSVEDREAMIADWAEGIRVISTLPGWGDLNTEDS